MRRGVRQRRLVAVKTTMLRRLLLTGSTVTFFASLSCRNGVVDPATLDPSTLVLEDVVYVCAAWHPAPPPVEFGLFDAFWGLASFSDSANAGPQPEHYAAMHAAGGHVIHAFHVPALRAILRPSAVPGLGAAAVRGVPDVQRFPVHVRIGIWRPITDADIEWIDSLGGVVTGRAGDDDVLVAVVPDPAIPVIRANVERVRYVDPGEADGCLD
jgi:hypothetical protein